LAGVEIMKNTMDKDEIIYGIRQLGVAERLGIVTDVWDEIKESRELEAISEDEKAILLSRLANYKKNPDAAMDWVQLKAEAHRRYAEES